MSGARDVPDAVQWHEGMMLAPQHFQQQAARHEQALLYHVMLAHPFHWGVVRLLVDRVALVSGMFRVLDLEAILPDGLIVSHDAASGGTLELDLTPYADAAAQATLTVHLAVPAAKGGAAAQGDLPRFQSVEGAPVADDTTGDGEMRIPRLRPRLTLLHTLGHTQRPPQKYATMPIAQLVYQNEAFTLTDFVPPALAVEEQSPLGRLSADIARRAREKALFLIERAGNLDRSGPGQQPMAREMQGEIHGLVAGLPPLETLLSTGRAHPFTVYLALTTMVGHMAASGAGALPPVLSRYDHDNCLICFGEIRDYMLRMLDRVKESFVAIPFQLDNGKFSLAIEPAWLERKLIIGVRAPVSMTEADVAAWIRNSLIASSSRVETLWEMRVMGAARRPVGADAELDIVRTRGTMLFEVENDPQYITAGQKLEIWNADGRAARIRPSEIILYVKSAG